MIAAISPWVWDALALCAGIIGVLMVAALVFMIVVYFLTEIIG